MTLFSLVLAGEAIFGLPFCVSRYFRPTYVVVFVISQTQLGVTLACFVAAIFAWLLIPESASTEPPRRKQPHRSGHLGEVVRMPAV